VTHRQAVHSQHQVGWCGAGNTGDIEQTVDVAVELFERGVDAARVGQVHLDVAVHRGGRNVAVQGDGFRAGCEQLFGHRVPDAGCCTGDDIALARKERHETRPIRGCTAAT
jgi:hypothetical protein